MGKRRGTEEQCLDASHAPRPFVLALNLTVLDDEFRMAHRPGGLTRTRRPENQVSPTPPVASACDIDWPEHSPGRVRSQKVPVPSWLQAFLHSLPRVRTCSQKTPR